ncbi:hypothetical protein F2S73_04260 [Pseudomonas syringae pv. actinidiae]|nr:hypothetical protein A259_01165 [Pseudomonas syringae pv. actinidiae ICMP 19070]NVL26454.1 hypothetical protein [Pseudomonas syringae pv. actinidiae]NVL34132.1 hypothetical protein [Pseudomonas syringae pv. actinidiae]
MLALITSPAAVLIGGSVDPTLVNTLNLLSYAGHYVLITSNRPKPWWFDQHFQGSGVKFQREIGRQNGRFLKTLAEKLACPTHNILVLAATHHDVIMAKNGRVMLVAAGWSTEANVRRFGIKINSAEQLKELMALADGWSGHWWFEGDCDTYSTRALADLSGMGRDITQAQAVFGKKLTQIVKQGGAQLTALALLTSRSLYIDGIDKKKDLLWGVYPSSKSTNIDDEVLSELTHSLRTAVCQVQMARRGVPLFIRHTPSIKRSGSRAIDRTDPTDQITTIHLNPEYRFNVQERSVVVVDDCTTHGLSFGVAAAFLKAAGANEVLGLGLGKFGNTLQQYQIEIMSDPFAPVSAGGFQVHSSGPFSGRNDARAQESLRLLMQL